jgi:outer membrane protein assembly factor BamB
VEGNRVYVLTSYLKLFCLNAATGQTLWSKDLVTLYNGSVIAWQNAASPLIEGDLLFMNCNGAVNRLLALNKLDGSEVWKGQNDRMTQSSPVPATIGGVRQIIFLAQQGLVSVVPTNGAVLWRYAFSYSTSTAASPVVASNVVYCSAAYGVGSAATRITGSTAPLTSTEVWRKSGANMNHWATPVEHNGYVYGVFGQASSTATLRCIDLATGNEQWRRSSPVGMGSILKVSGHLLVFTETGYLLLVKADPTQFTEIVSFRALDGSRSSDPGAVKCWNSPAISNGRIYARSTTEAVALDVAAAAPLRLSSGFAGAGGDFRLLVGTQDGSLIDATRAGKIDVFSKTNLTSGTNGWSKLTNATTLVNGQVQFDDPDTAAKPRRFFRVEERPW